MYGRLEVVCGHIRLLDAGLYDSLVRETARRIAEDNLFVGLSLACDVLAWPLADVRAWLKASNTPVWTCGDRIPEPFVACKARMSTESLLRYLDSRPAGDFHASDLCWATGQTGAVVTRGGCMDRLEGCKLAPVEIDTMSEQNVPAASEHPDDAESGPARVYADLDAFLLTSDPELVTAIVERLVKETCPDRVLLLQSAMVWLLESGIAPALDRLPLKELPGRFFSPTRLDEPYATGPLGDLDQEWRYVACRLSDLGDGWETACRAILLNAAGQGKMHIAVGREWPVRTDAGRFGWSQNTVCVINYPRGSDGHIA